MTVVKVCQSITTENSKHNHTAILKGNGIMNPSLDSTKDNNNIQLRGQCPCSPRRSVHQQLLFISSDHLKSALKTQASFPYYLVIKEREKY